MKIEVVNSSVSTRTGCFERLANVLNSSRMSRLYRWMHRQAVDVRQRILSSIIDDDALQQVVFEL